ncbi:hypothetical protein A0128_16410 [Leptospira tipperaryensis]|uniref:SnoaL-like domain-containing protein n=1 Tax=Leptospira tipperaryensis TaxID=2564040 RepID=A0A1D7V0C5_9LEPT|nr:nuclear transport factor 2 family protein [Leptospira tipperaryensis]AOP35286.1 hypothetical protein A0128_16410 [Leptospira tipperaryensis]
MKHPNLEIIDRFFDAYVQRDWTSLKKVLSQDAKWSFPGQHPYSGMKNGFEEVIHFFDTMSSVMGKSNVKAEKLIVSANDDYVIESQHIFTNREDGINLNHLVCVLWKFADGKIVEGVHFFASPVEADSFFTKISQINLE